MFRWPLNAIDETDIESLIPFVFRYPAWKAAQSKDNGKQKIFADEANWL